MNLKNQVTILSKKENIFELSLPSATTNQPFAFFFWTQKYLLPKHLIVFITRVGLQ